jgi:predicted Zn-dependent protease
MAISVRIRLAFVLGLLALSAVVVVTVGRSSHSVSLSAAMELWGDVLRDADDFGLQLTRVSAHDEMELGDGIASGFIAGSYMDPALEPYVSAVGSALVRNVSRKDIVYKFHVIKSTEVNAFAIPGGHVLRNRSERWRIF